MSTSAHIFIRLDDSDIGKTMKQDLSKIGVNMNFVKEQPREVTLEKRYMGIRCQWDCYPDGVGNVLLSEFKDKESIINLLLGGDASSLIGGVVQYATIYEESKEPWEYNKPKFYDAIPDTTEDFLYLFQDNVWYIRKHNESEFKWLSDVIKK